MELEAPDKPQEEMNKKGMQVSSKDSVQEVNIDDKPSEEHTLKEGDPLVEGAENDLQVAVERCKVSDGDDDFSNVPLAETFTLQDFVSKLDPKLDVENFSKHRDYVTENEGVEVQKKGA